MPETAAARDAKLAEVVETWFPRFLANGLDYLDVRRTLDAIGTWPDWAPAWEAAADRYAGLAEKALAAGHRLTGGEHLRRAALTLQFAQFVLVDDPAERARLHERQVVLYALAAPLLRPPARRLEVELDGIRYAGYLRLPEGVTRPPLVLLLPGLESTKEQFSTFEPFFLERGLATLTFEGPGQGEARRAAPFDDERWGAAFAAFAAAAEAREELALRIAVVGTSFGGYLALRWASLVHGLQCVVDIAGPYSLEPFEELPPVIREGFTAFTGAADEQDAAARLRTVGLRGALERLRVPALVVHGGRDGVFPPAHAERIVAELGDRAELRLEPEGNHSCNNLHTVVRPAVADWVAERLAS